MPQNIKENDLAYEYGLALCGAIERFVENRKKENSSALEYKGADLTYSLERALYFTYLNNKTMFGIYTKHRRGELSEANPVKLKNPTDKELALHLGNIEEKTLLIRLNMVSAYALRETIKQTCTYLQLHRLTGCLRKLINYSRQRNKPHIIFSAHSERFIRYLEPITQNLTESFAYLTADKKAIAYARRRNIPVIALSSFGYRFERWAKRNKLLKEFTLSEKYDLIEDSLKRIAPATVVVVEGNAPIDEITNRICKKYSITSVCIQQGWSPMVHNGFRNMTYSKMLVWGKGFADLLQSYNPAQTFIPTGSHVVHLTGERTASQEIRTVALFCQGITVILNQHAWNELLRLGEELRRHFPHLTVIIREHPSYPVDTYEKDNRKWLENLGIQFMSGPKYSLDQVLAQSDISVSIFSSTILESVAAGVLPVVMNVTSYPRYFPDIEKGRAGFETKNVEDTVDLIGQFVRGEKKVSDFATTMDAFAKNFFAADKNEAVKNIVREIEGRNHNLK